MSTFEKEKFMSFYKGTKYETGASQCYDAVSKALTKYGINSRLTLIGALATCRVEVGKEFKPIKEISSGIQYEKRKDLGNTQLGDGVRYKGRGLIQITGKYNYSKYGKKLGLDLLNNPDLVLNLEVSANILALFFKENNIPKYCEVNNWTKVRKLINGGTNGLSTFISVVNQYIIK